ncbi:hypothetical protein TRFO_19326 [Tritrichomonas foetus]|uniref:Uncharacterized protein n=1 Tax=Tritrichomonas foetus TaxID=1144522 RepID=A0A1J4KJD9_9EUKA|nr:hypothetical protein TRFO_19326 [Tritrichomonas foetus]|eukprot:OHT11331.1 hypothetical protein TRFO_19326 [Tritrichomonas foetus]
MFLPGRSGNSVKNRFNWLERRHLTTFPMCSPPIRSGSLPTRMRPNLLPIPIINIKNEKEGKQNDTSSNITTSPPSSNDIIQNTIVSTKEMLDNRTSCHYMADCDPSSPESPELNNNSVVGLDLFNPNDFEEIWIEPTTNEEYMYFHVEY